MAAWKFKFDLGLRLSRVTR